MAVTSTPSPFTSATQAEPASRVGPLHHLKLLFWLKWTMTVRALTRSRSSVIGIILTLAFFVPLSLLIGVGFGVGFSVLPPFTAEQLLRGALLGIFLIWLLSPLAGFAVNDSYDITRLFVYPVSVRRIFTGAILGSLLDITTLLLLPTLLAALWAFGHVSVFAFLVALVALPLFLFQTLALSQAALLATAGILRSRKFRDIAIVVVPTFWLGYQIFSRFFSSSITKNMGGTNWKAVLQSPGWEIANLLPPGLTARAIALSSQNHYFPALGFLFALAAVTTATVYFSAWLVQKAYNGDDVAPRAHLATLPSKATAPTAPATEEISPAITRDRTLLGFKLPAVVAAVFDKEIKYYLREPYYRLVLMNFVYALVMGLVVAYGGGSSGRRPSSSLNTIFPGGAVWSATGILLLRQSLLFSNQFGVDGAAASLLLGFPASRRQILIGKNLPQLLVCGIVNIVAAIALCLLTKNLPLLVVAVPWVLLALIVMAATGNLLSIFYPSPVVMKGFRARGQALSAASTQGIGMAFLYLGISLGVLFLYLPVLAALIIPYYFAGNVWLLLTIPLAVLYTGGLYLLSLKLAEPELLAREVSIIEKVYRAPDAA